MKLTFLFEVKLKRLKKFNQNLLADKNEVVVVKEMKLEADKDVDTKGNHVEKPVKEKNKDVSYIKHEATELKEKTFKNESDEVYENEVNEFNDLSDKKLEERKFSKVNVKTAKKLYDEVIPNAESVGVKDLNDDVMYKQVPVGACNDDEVGMGMSSFNLVPLLHTIDAMLLISSKTLHEQRLLVTRLSRFLWSNLNSHHQPETTQYSGSLCSCQC